MRCLAKTKAGHRCKREATAFDLCRQHRDKIWRGLITDDLVEALGRSRNAGWLNRPLEAPPLTPDAIVRLKNDLAEGAGA